MISVADTVMSVKLLNVTKTTAQWAASDVKDIIISKGLLCVELDSDNKSWVKVGDGVHKFAELPYITDAAISSLGNLFSIQGVVASTSDLPSTGNKTGDVYFVGSAATAGSDKFEEYVWTAGGTWEFIGKVTDPVIPTYTGGTGITIDSNDAINLDIASTTSLGGIIVGTNLSIDSSGVLSATDTTYVFDGTYNSSTNKAATVSTVTSAISNLSGNITGSGAASKTITALSESNGIVTATFGDIQIATSQVTGLGDAAIKGVTDNTTPTAVTSTDTNLITGRTLFNAGYAKTSDVVTDVSVNGSSIVSNGVASISGIAKSVSVNGGAAISADSTTGQVSLTGIVTGLNYTDSTGSSATMTPTNGNLDLTSITLNCTL
jgi:hypothetical protein